MPSNPTPAEGVVVPIYPTEAMLDAAHGVPVMTFEGKPVYTTSREAEAIYLAMLAARPSAPTQSAAQTGEVLWMMHVRGPDDIYPAPDYATAVQWCDYLNSELATIRPDVLLSAIPALWTGSPQSHADGLAAAISGWTRPALSQPEQSQ